jgi:hypothetical protein
MSEISNQDFINLLLKSIGDIKGATGLGIVVIIVQLLMAFFKTQLSNFAGKYKLLIVTFLTLVLGVLTLKTSGLTWSAALLHSSTIAAFQVFFNQLYKQFFVKND